MAEPQFQKRANAGSTLQNPPTYKLKPIAPQDATYWWHVLEGKKLVSVADYIYDPRIYMFTEENLPQPIRVLNQKEKPIPPQDYEPGRYTLWVDDDRVCVGLEIG